VRGTCVFVLFVGGVGVLVFEERGVVGFQIWVGRRDTFLVVELFVG
jgi:hypothetical protein